MTAKPWMPLYIAEYLADTRHLSAAEHGAYMLLIMHYWQTGALPNDDRQLARIACMESTEWLAARPVIEPLFKSGLWKHTRVEKELARAAHISAVRSAAAEQKHAVARENQIANAGVVAHANAHAFAPAFAKQMDPHSQSHSPIQSKSNNGGGVVNVKKGGPPKHGAVSRDKKFIYFRAGTQEYEAYAADFKEVNMVDPIANEHGGRWFKVMGEAGGILGRRAVSGAA